MRKDLALNISLASLNMDIERERSMRSRVEGKEMLLSGEALEEEDLVCQVMMIKINRLRISEIVRL